MPKTKKKKGKHEQAVVEAVASENHVAEEPKKKKYQRSVSVRNAGEVAKFLVFNAKNFRGRYEGDALYSFKVDIEDKAFIDRLLSDLEERK